MGELVLILKALSDRNRLRAVAAIMSHDELCVCQLVELLQITGASVSRLLGQLVQAGILQSRKEGRWMYYRVDRTNEVIKPVMDWIKKELAGDEYFTRDREKLLEIMACGRENICRKQRGEAAAREKNKIMEINIGEGA